MAVEQVLAKNNIPIVPHPPYSPDLAPSDFWLFPTLKTSLRGRRFASKKTLTRDCARSKKKIFINVTKTAYTDGKYFEGD
jgi:transposase